MLHTSLSLSLCPNIIFSLFSTFLPLSQSIYLLYCSLIIKHFYLSVIIHINSSVWYLLVTKRLRIRFFCPMSVRNDMGESRFSRLQWASSMLLTSSIGMSVYMYIYSYDLKVSWFCPFVHSWFFFSSFFFISY